MHYLSKIIFFAIIILFTFTGCSSNSADELSARSVRILLGRVGTRYATYIEFVEPNKINIVLFGREPLPIPHSSIAFDMTLLDDFISNSQDMELVFPSANWGNSVIIDEWTFELSEEQLDHICSLIENVVRNRADREFELAPMLGWIPYVWAIIDNNMYWSLYTSDIYSDSWTRRDRRRYMNSDLLAFVYELIDLSPYPVSSPESFRTPGNRSQ